MKPSVPYRSLRRARSRWFALGGLVAALAATALTACGPRDEAPLAGGSAGAAPQGTATTVAAAPAATVAPQIDASRAGTPVPSAPAPAPAPALAPAPAMAPPPVNVAAAPVYPQDGPVQVQAAPTVQAPAPVGRAPVVARDRVGSVTAIEPVRQRPQGSGAGAVIGGVLGGVVGNQFGHGLGRAAMTGVGAAGGAIAGNNVERNYKTAVVGYRVHVRLDNGNTRTFQRKNIGNLHVGDRVRLDANGFRRA
jgi:outer membrane lipoprotein SlyB